ncbi:hypothetical protein DYB37_013482 [Aphanomyces astaci]|uniref:Protein kinase domain-containing protein n=2 Tax=Aphanomyces astaci TaxID=112090 RepID=A0A3R6XTJ8_APHAT|nr:hypothetical protein DYB37_013482 [Aphanomyces astaci]
MLLSHLIFHAHPSDQTTTVYSYYDVYDSPFARFDPNRRISTRQDSVLTAFIVLCTVGLAGVVVHRLLSVRGAKKKASRQSPSPPSNPTQSQDDDTHNISHTHSATSDPPQHINWRNLADLQLDMTAIELVAPLAAGSYGVVWRAKLRSNEVVAVKTCSRTSLDDVQNFVDELALLSTLHSPYLVSLLGVTWTHACDLKAVLEYMDSGDLRQLLDNTPPPSPEFLTNSPSFSWRQKLECALSVGHALVYLKQQHVIHRDLKSRNVLLDSKRGTKLADFGIAKHLHDDPTHASMTTGVGTYRWMAPEVLTFRRYSVAVDVYSFGVLLTELDTHRVPFTDVQNDHGRSVADAAVVCMVLYEHLRPSFSNKCPLWFVELGRRCMQADARDRPTPEDVVDILTRQLGMLANVMDDVVDER